MFAVLPASLAYAACLRLSAHACLSFVVDAVALYIRYAALFDSARRAERVDAVACAIYVY